jgi:hypothetical protein
MCKSFVYYLVFETSLKKDKRYVVKDLCIAASTLCGGTPTVTNSFFKAMKMDPIPASAFYKYINNCLAPLVVDKANNQMKEIRAKYKCPETHHELILEGDMRHASVRGSKHSTMAFIHWPTGKVIWAKSESHADNKGSASSEVRLFKLAMEEMIQREGLKIAEVIHDDCTTISKFLADVVSHRNTH